MLFEASSSPSLLVRAKASALFVPRDWAYGPRALRGHRTLVPWVWRARASVLTPVRWQFHVPSSGEIVWEPFHLPEVEVTSQDGLELTRSAGARVTVSRKAILYMKHTIQVRIFRGERQYVAECLDLPVVTEALTLDELTGNIQEAISLHLEGENLEELGFAANPTILATLELQAVA